MDISIATIEWEKGSLVALQLILLPLVFKTEKNCSTTPKLPKSINSNSLFLVIHQFRRKSCFSCVFSFSFSLCLSIYSCALSGTPSTFFGFWRTTTSSIAAIASVSAFVLFWAIRVLRAWTAAGTTTITSTGATFWIISISPSLRAEWHSLAKCPILPQL